MRLPELNSPNMRGAIMLDRHESQEMKEATSIVMRCTACTGLMHLRLVARDYNREISGDRYRYFQCDQCRLISLQNVPPDLGRFYETGYYLRPSTDEALEAGVAHEQYKIDLVRQFVPTGRLLEIGPSWGAFCLLAKRSGYS